ncbi:hypothetical protein K502DRAFT_47244 [Neoconidiobolus thromboides FSU 785]|nr:hypothetical protein K502DRAFT_47244 [Neoconidiobolus thromboides FSU 785]
MDNKRIKNQFYTSKSYINQLQNKSSISRRNDSNDLNSKVITKHISQEDKIEAPTYKEVKAWLTEELKLNQSDLIGVINGIDEIKPKFEQKLLTEEEYHLLTKSDCDRIILNYLIKHIRDENAITELRNQLYNLSIEEANMIKGRILKKNKYYEGSEYISLKERLKDQEIQFRFQNRIYEEQVKLLDDKKKRITELKKEKDELIQNIKEDKTKVIAKKKIHDYLEQKNEEVKELLDDIKVEQNESEECNKRMELVFGLIKDSIENNKDNKALILNHLTENFVNIDGSLLMSYLRDKTSILKEEVMANFWKLKIETNENIKQEDYNIASEEFDYYQVNNNNNHKSFNNFFKGI